MVSSIIKAASSKKRPCQCRGGSMERDHRLGWPGDSETRNQETDPGSFAPPVYHGSGLRGPCPPAETGGEPPERCY